VRAVQSSGGLVFVAICTVVLYTLLRVPQLPSTPRSRCLTETVHRDEEISEKRAMDFLESLQDACPAAKTEDARTTMRALVGGHLMPLSRSDVPARAKSLYDAAMARGPESIAEIACDVIIRVTGHPSAYDNLVGTGKKRKRQRNVDEDAQVADPLSVKEHRRFRFTIYREIESRLGYHVADFAVPLPVLSEQMVKIVLPGPLDESFTGFKATPTTD